MYYHEWTFSEPCTSFIVMKSKQMGLSTGMFFFFFCKKEKRKKKDYGDICVGFFSVLLQHQHQQQQKHHPQTYCMHPVNQTSLYLI